MRAAAASDATRARLSPGGRKTTPSTATWTGVRVDPRVGGMSELAATTDPCHVIGAVMHVLMCSCVQLAIVGGSRDTTSPSRGYTAGGTAGAAAITCSACSYLPARWSRRAVAEHLSRAAWACLRATCAVAFASAAMRAIAALACPPHAVCSHCTCGWCTTVSGCAFDCAVMRAMASAARRGLGAACGSSDTTMGWGVRSIVSAGTWLASAGGAACGSGVGSMFPHCIMPSCTWAGMPAATIALLLWCHFDAGGWIDPLGTCSASSSCERPDGPSAAAASPATA